MKQESFLDLGKTFHLISSFLELLKNKKECKQICIPLEKSVTMLTK
jgi:hypothetical protein